MSATDRPRLCVFTLGGTIASLPGERGSAVGPTLVAEKLVAAVPGLGKLATLEAITSLTIPSGELELDAAIRDPLAAGCVGAVITQGTETLEETACTLDLLRGGGGAGRRYRDDTGLGQRGAYPGGDATRRPALDRRSQAR